MPQTRDEMTQHVAGRRWWAGARRDETRSARRPYRKQVVDGVYRLDEGAYRRLCEWEATGGEPVGWQRWRRQLLEQTRAQVIVCAQAYHGIFHLAEYSLLVGVTRKDRPPAIRTRQDILTTYGLLPKT